jgi:hypothetical protein
MLQGVTRLICRQKIAPTSLAAWYFPSPDLTKSVTGANESERACEKRAPFVEFG